MANIKTDLTDLTDLAGLTYALWNLCPYDSFANWPLAFSVVPLTPKRNPANPRRIAPAVRRKGRTQPPILRVDRVAPTVLHVVRQEMAPSRILPVVRLPQSPMWCPQIAHNAVLPVVMRGVVMDAAPVIQIGRIPAVVTIPVVVRHPRVALMQQAGWSRGTPPTAKLALEG